MDASLRRGLAVSAEYAGLALVAVVLWFMLVMAVGPRSSAAANIRPAALVMGLLAPAVLMGAAWWQRFEHSGDGLGVLGAWLVTFSGYALPHPEPWAVWTAFLLPWALLVVELPPRHRVVLLAMQWLASVPLLESLTTTTASTTALAALGIVHLVLVWATLRGTRLAAVPLLLGAVLGGLGLLVTGVFLVLGPTVGRAEAVLSSAALLLVVFLLHRARKTGAARLPTLVPMRRAA